MLLVFDNCEHLLDPIAALVDGLLKEAPGLHVDRDQPRAVEIG